MSAHHQLPEEPGDESFVIRTPQGMRFETPQTENALEFASDHTLEWLWPERIPRRRLTLLEGPPGCGKSFVALSLAAMASSGAPWPDEPQVPREPAGVLLLPGANYLVDDTVFERLERAGAELENCHRLTEICWRLQPADEWAPKSGGVREIAFPYDIPALVHVALRVCQPRAALVVIDPLMDFLPEPRLLERTIRKLNEAAADSGAAIVATLPAEVHREEDGRLAVRPRGNDAAARCIWCIEEDADDPARRLLVPHRMNFCERLPEGLAFRMKDGLVTWEALPQCAAIRPGRSLSESAKWLKTALAEKDIPAAELFLEAREFGFSSRMLHWARRKLGGRVYREGFGREGRWIWSLGAGLPSTVGKRQAAVAGAGPKGSPGGREQHEDAATTGASALLRTNGPNVHACKSRTADRGHSAAPATNRRRNSATTVSPMTSMGGSR